MKLVYASDVHGDTSHYDELLELVGREAPRVLILGGDLLPPPHGLSSPAGREAAMHRQHDYLLNQLLPRLETVKKSGVDVLLLLGNYDLGGLAATFETESAARGLLTLHERAREIDGEVFAGLSWVNFTPFPLKDWETYDLEEGETSPGVVDHKDPRAVFTWERPDGFPPLSRSLDRLAGKVPAAGTGGAIYVIHVPPHGSDLDVISRRENPVGSKAVRRFIGERQPRLTLHGHIHEAPHVSGRWAVRLGQTLAIQPGQTEEQLHAVVLDTLEPATTARHTVFGPLGAGG